MIIDTNAFGEPCLDYEAYFDLKQAYIEISTLCANIINTVAGDVVDGVTTIHRCHGNTAMTQEEALNLLDLSYHYHCDPELTAKSHISNIDFFHSLLTRLCASPPESMPKIFPQCLTLWFEHQKKRREK